MVTHPQTLDVMVTSNLFGDILTDIGSAISGSLASRGCEHQSHPAEPVDVRTDSRLGAGYRGQGIANPIGAIWAGALMLEHLGHRELHDKVLGAIERVVAGGKIRTPDLGGRRRPSR